MAEKNALMQGYYGPEYSQQLQTALTRRDAIGDAPAPWEVAPMAMGGAAAGAGVGATMAIRELLKRGFNPAQAMELLTAIGVTTGAGAGAGAVYDTTMGTPYDASIRDAEGQRGGYYGNGPQR